MSSDTNSGDAMIALFDALYTNNYCTVAASVLFIYDTFITFDREVKCFWTPKRTGAAAPLLFFANKWISITFYVMSLVSFASFPSEKRFVCGLANLCVHRRNDLDRSSCAGFIIVSTAFVALQFIPGAIFAALRAYVLSKSKLLGLFIMILSLAPVGVNLIPYGFNVSGDNIPPFGCISTDGTTDTLDLRERLIFVSRVPLIVADIVLTYVTWAKLSCRDALRNMRQSNKRQSLPDVLFRDGTIYFVILLFLNVLHLLFSVTSFGVQDANVSLVTLFTSPITAILVSRFLLALQEANQAVVRVDHDDPLHSSRDPYDSMPSFVLSLGAYINPDLPAPHEEDGGDHSALNLEGSGGRESSSGAH